MDNPAFLVIESGGEKVGIRHDLISGYKISENTLVLHMVSGHSCSWSKDKVPNLIFFLEDNSLLLDTEKDE
jgi:hypothetical protein